MESPCIYIESTHHLQRKLLADFLRKDTGVECQESFQSYFSTSSKSHHKALILWDYYGRSEKTDDLHQIINKTKYHISPKTYTAAFNVPNTLNIEHDFIKKGLHGLFYENDSPSQISKGTKSILQGQLWFSRSALSKTICDILPINNQDSLPQPYLTNREKEILVKISEGLSNIEIAEGLYLSKFTVKTHIQNIYKKINVTKRAQATHWAMKNVVI